MVVKEGYKNTEVGVIPEDWEVKKQMDIVKYINGRAYSIHEWETRGVPVVRLQNLTNKGGDFYYSQLKLPEYQYMYKGDLIYMWSASFGPYIWWGDKAIFHYHIWRIECDKMKIDKSFYYYKLIEITEELKKGTSGSTMLHLTKGFMENYLVSLPPLPEQTAIATVLSDTDNLIQALEKKIAKKELIKKGAMQELLEPKEGWERIKIDDAIDVYRGGSPRPIQDYITPLPFGVNWIKIGDTSSDGKYITHTKERIIPEGALYSRSVSKGDFLLSNSMSFGRPYILKIDGCIHDGWLVLQNYQATFDLEFLYYTLISEDVLNQYLTKASGSGVLNLNKELVKTVELNRPKDVAEQTRIAQILSDMDTEIESLQDKLSKYKQLKQGLMQELLTGRIRLV